MISSAVVIPEQEPETTSPSPNLKRRQSSISSDSNKRPRLDTQGSFEDVSQSNTAGAMSPPSRRKSALGVGAAEEKKRGQRLYGALLGALSQKSSKPAHKKRDEIEQRQRDRIRKDSEEKEEERRRKREELDRVRRVEQKAWDEQSMRIRHRNMRAMAEFLQTKAEPRLYYKPWELREEEEDLIKRQIAEAEQKITAELEENGMVDDSKRKSRERKSTPSKPNHGKDDAKDQKHDEDHAMTEASQNDANDVEELEATNKVDDTNKEANAKAADEERPKDDDHAGEELVEGQEDDVIY